MGLRGKAAHFVTDHHCSPQSHLRCALPEINREPESLPQAQPHIPRNAGLQRFPTEQFKEFDVNRDGFSMSLLLILLAVIGAVGFMWMLRSICKMKLASTAASSPPAGTEMALAAEHDIDPLLGQAEGAAARQL